MAKKKIILDVDTGSDDAVAIMAALLSPDLDVLGITVTHGNLPLPNTLDNTLRVVQHIGSTVPVYAGCSEPMVMNLLPGNAQNTPRRKPGGMVNGQEKAVHEKALPLPAPVIQAQEQHACTFLIEAIRNSKEKVTLIPVGPATNIAMALRMDPGIVDNIEEIIPMGGGAYMSNYTIAAEFNFWADPEAAKIMMDCGAKITVVPLDATFSVALDSNDAARIASSGTPAALFAAQMINHRIEVSSALSFYKLKTTSLHDPLCVCAAIDPTVITETADVNCDIDIGGAAAYGQLLLDTRASTEYTKNHHIALKADKEKFVSMMCGIFSRQ